MPEERARCSVTKYGTPATLPYASNPKPLKTWLRKEFAIADAPADSAGFIAYLNGTEVARRSLPASVNANTPATPHAHGTFQTIV